MNAPIDMRAFIAPKSDQLNADDLIGGSMTITITRVSASPDSPEQPVAIFFEGDDGKPFKPCKSMRRVMVNAWGADAAQYAGRSMTLYRDPKVQFGGMQVGGIRISHMSDIDSDLTMALTATRAKRAPYTVKKLVAERGLTVDQARADLEAAASIDELRAIWSRKAMAPFRGELGELLETLKSDLSGATRGRTDEQHGDQRDGGEDDQ